MQWTPPEHWAKTPVKIAVLVILTVIIAIVTIVCLQGGTQVVFPHLYYAPIILAAFWFGRRGIPYAVALAAFYLWAVVAISSPDSQTFIAAALRACVFVAISLVIAILADIIQQRRDHLSVSEERFRKIWESVHAGIILVDADTHTITAANPEAERLTGYAEPEMIGHVCHRFVCPAGLGSCPISDLGMTLDHTERTLLTRDGQSVPVLKTVTPLEIGGKRYYIESFIAVSPAS